MSKFLTQLNRDYLKIHQSKEDLFWKTYMGVEKNTDLLAQAEKDFKNFISEESTLQALRQELSSLSEESQIKVCQGWIQFFESNVIESKESKTLQEELVQLESDIFAKRAKISLHYTQDSKEIEASTRVLATNLSNDSEETRQSSHKALLDLEHWVSHQAMPDLIRLRNRFARSLGFSNYFEYAVRKNEKMSVDELFSILDSFEEKTQKGLNSLLASVKEKHGDKALQGHNFKFYTSGALTQELDPYFPFEKALEVWASSFHKLGVSYRGAELNLDLLDRKGKYENGFMHSPIPTFFDDGKWQSGKINFTSNAYPTQVGSGYNGLHTLLHEGGHAAHFANVTQGAPCFSQEFPPTSMAYAETQSMFFDSLLNDADWMKSYAKNRQGESIPNSLLKKQVLERQPLKAYSERSIMALPYLERKLYEEEITDPDTMIAMARSVEQKIVGLPISSRPLLSIPHILGGDSACCYHGYLLAHMAVYQTRNFFLERDGYLVDNAKIGPDLCEKYWQCGNSLTHNETLLALTGEGFNPEYLAQDCNTTPDEKWKSEEAQLAKHKESPKAEIDLNASITIVHGEETLASNSQSYSSLFADFESSIARLFPQ